MKRPDQWDNRIIDAVAPKVLDRVLKSKPLDKYESRDDLLDCIKECLEDSIEWDGGVLASWLNDRYYWDIDTQLVDSLDCASHLQWNTHRDLVRQWVRETQPRPAFGWGETVYYQRFWNEVRAAEIFKVDHEYAQYVVNDDINKAIRKGSDFVCGTIVNWEDCW